MNEENKTLNKENTNKNSEINSNNNKNINSNNNLTNENINSSNSNKKETKTVNSNIIYKPNPNKNIYPLCGCSSTRIWLRYVNPMMSYTIFATYSFFIVPAALVDSIFIHRFSFKKLIIFYSIFNFDFLLTLYSLFDVSTSNPGYQEEDYVINQKEFYELKPEIVINSEKIELRHCYTCDIIRLPRTFHCNNCNKCILKHDHHCPFVNNCIGKNNLTKFFLFILNSFIFTTLVLIIQIWFVVDRGMNFKKSFLITLRSLICLALIVISFLTAPSLLCFLIRYIEILTTNVTRREYLKNNMKRELVDKGCCNNCLNTCCYDNKDELEEKYDELIEELKKNKKLRMKN